MICKNCENKFEGDFCNNCGQKSNTKRVDFSYLINEIYNSLFQVNRGIFYTIKELSLRPGKSIRNYLNGKRKLHYKPLAFILLISTFYALISHFIGEKTVLGEALSGMLISLKNHRPNPSNIQKTLNFLLNNIVYTSILFIPVFSLASYLMFIKSKYNYFEHLILNFYISGQQTIILIVFSVLLSLFKENYYIKMLPTVLSILYLFWVYIRFFNTKKTYSVIILTILIYIVYFSFIILPISYALNK